MTLHGFRLYAVEVTPGLGRSRYEFDEAPLLGAARLFANRLRELQGQTFIREAVYRPRDPAMASATTAPPRTPVMRIDNVRQTGESVEITVSYGRKGEYGFAIDMDGGADIQLGSAAASRPYRVIVHFPKAGNRAVMVSEVVSRTHVGEVLLRRLSVENFQAAEAAGTDEDGGWLRWLPIGMLDEGRIREVLENGTIEGIRLRRKAQTAGGKRVTRDITLTQIGLPQGKKKEAEKLVKKWVKRYLGIADGAANRPIASLVELVDADVTGVGFTDGVFTISENGKQQSLGPRNLEKILMYPMGDDEPSWPKLRKASNERLRPLLESESIPIELPN